MGKQVLSRRTVGSGIIGLAAASALVTSGCDPDDGLALPGLPDDREEPDRDQVLAALDDERAVLDHVVRVQRRHRQLRRTLAATAAVHRAHVELLRGAVEDAEVAEPEAEPVPGDPVKAAAGLVRLEHDLADRHVSTAMECRSGSLARVVAVMSAAAAQQAVVLAPLAGSAKEADG
jgi:hypothetical protein